MNFIGDTNALVELDEIRADAEKNVLAVVDDFARTRMLVGGSTSPEVGTLLENRNLESRVSQGAGRGQSGKAASGDRDGLLR